MKFHPFALVFALLAPLVVAAADQDPDLAARANASANEVGNVDFFIDEVYTAVDLAIDGGYGRLRRGDIPKLEKSRDIIVDLLDGRKSALELTPEQRIELYNAQEMITGIIRNDDKGRMVCVKQVSTGSRVPKTECMSVAEREGRARLSRTATDDIIRTVCVPGEASRCAK